MNEGFYVTVKRGTKTGWLAGPFVTRDAAQAEVKRVQNVAAAIDPWTAFDAFGVSKMSLDRRLPDGVLNGYVAFPDRA